MAEVGAEVGYAPHHAKKLALIFSAMRHHAERLRAAGYRVDYVTLDDPANAQSLPGELERAYARLGPFEEVVVTRPGEWRVQETLDALRGSGASPCAGKKMIASSRAARIRPLGQGAQAAAHGVFLPGATAKDWTAHGGGPARGGNGTSTPTIGKAGRRRRRIAPWSRRPTPWPRTTRRKGCSP